MNPAKILVVEDDALLREVYVETLTGQGYSVETAVDGKEGLLKMQSGGWDLVLLDIILPEINGIDIMKRLKNTQSMSTPNKKVIFLTNIDTAGVFKEALSLGNGYLIKSQLTPGDLIREVKLYLSQ